MGRCKQRHGLPLWLCACSPGPPWHGKKYRDLDDVAVHGGVTFTEADVPCDAPGADTDWWIGFDCAHAFDAPDPELARSRSDSGPSYPS
jgi:hypothetical protein